MRDPECRRVKILGADAYPATLSAGVAAHEGTRPDSNRCSRAGGHGLTEHIILSCLNYGTRYEWARNARSLDCVCCGIVLIPARAAAGAFPNGDSPSHGRTPVEFELSHLLEKLRKESAVVRTLRASVSQNKRSSWLASALSGVVILGFLVSCASGVPGAAVVSILFLVVLAGLIWLYRTLRQPFADNVERLGDAQWRQFKLRFLFYVVSDQMDATWLQGPTKPAVSRTRASS